MIVPRVLFFILTASKVSVIFASDICSFPPDDLNEINSCGKEEVNEQPNIEDIELKWQKEAYKKREYTSDEEWPYRDKLDEADEYIGSDPKLAIELFDEILKEIKSPRAIYARARSRQFLEDIELTNGTKKVENIIDEFSSIIYDKTALPKIWQSAINQALILSHTAKLIDKEISLLDYILFERTDESKKYLSFERFLGFLGENYFILRNYELGFIRMEKGFETFWITDRSTYSQFIFGLLLKNIPTRKKEGNKILRSIEIDNVVKMGVEVERFTSKCKDNGYSNKEIDDIYKEASKLHIFPSIIQRPYEFFPDFKNKPVWNIENDKEITVFTEEIDGILSIWPNIKDEALELMENMNADWMQVPNFYVEKGNWSEYPLFTFGLKRHHNCAQTPSTCEYFRNKFKQSSYFKKGTVKFILLQPGTIISAFHGPSNTVLRACLGLQIPKEFEMIVGRHNPISISEGQIQIFDNSFERDLINGSSEKPVLLLSFDLPHPDMDDTTKKLTYLYSARSQFIF